MQITILAQHYAPEEVSGAVLATELAEDLVQHGHQVTFVTCAPNYPQGIIFPGYKNAPYQSEMLNSVRVIRTWSYITPCKDFWRRVLNFGTFSLSAFFGGLLAGKTDVIMSYSPPLPLGVSAWMLSRLLQVPWVLRVEDLYPEAAVAAGLLRNRHAIHFFERLEAFLYKRASRISLISESFRKNLIDKGVPKGKLSVEPVWADPDQVRPLKKNNEFRKKHNLNGKFVVMYAGALGYTSALEEVIAAAAQLQEDDYIKFLIIGEGVKKETLVRFCRQQKLPNVLFLPFQPREQFAEMMAAADLNLVTLNPTSASFSMPNKVFNIMASERPILAVTPQESEVAKLIETWNCGINAPNGNPLELAMKIKALSQDREYLEKLGKNGRQALERHYSRKNCISLYESTLQQAIG